MRQCKMNLNEYLNKCTGGNTKLYSFIQGLLERPFSELFSANVSSWSKYKYIAFKIFSCRIDYFV